MIVKESVIKRINRDTNDCILYPVLNKEGYGQMQSYLEGKGRQAKGDANGRYIDGRTTIKINKQSTAHGRRLTKEQVLEVRELRKRYLS